MRYLSLFSGIEAATEAWKLLGWECVGVAEIETLPRSVLARLHPTIPNLGDVTKITEARIATLGRIDAVVFGSPCQDLSVAGKRKGLAGERSGLFFDAMRIVSWARLWGGCRFAIWENVPGAFTSNKGRDFASVVEHLAGLEHVAVPPKGWGTEGCAVGSEAMVEWATLDAQWFGVAQRRRRVFAVADFGDWANRPPILLEPQSMRGNFAPSREAGKEATAGTLRSTDGGDSAMAGHLAQAFGGNNTSGPIDVATARNACATASGRMDFESETFILDPVPFDTTQITSAANYSNPQPGDPCHPLAAGAHPPAIAFAGRKVRRLTPRECERLQGFPDDYTAIPWRGKPAEQCPDGPRYKALGNSMAVPVMGWIGHRIDFVARWF